MTFFKMIGELFANNFAHVFLAFCKCTMLMVRLTATEDDASDVKSHACSFFQPFGVNNHCKIFMAPWPTGLLPLNPCSAAVRDDSGSPSAAAATAANAATSSAAVQAFLCTFLLAFFLFQRALHDVLPMTATMFHHHCFVAIAPSQSQHS